MSVHNFFRVKLSTEKKIKHFNTSLHLLQKIGEQMNLVWYLNLTSSSESSVMMDRQRCDDRNGRKQADPTRTE